MSAGPDLVEFRDNLDETLVDLGRLREDAQEFGARLDSAGDAATQYLGFRFVITTLDGAVSSAVTMLKLSENFTPLKPSSRVLKEVLEAVQPVIVKLRDVTDKAGSVNPTTGELKGLDKLADKVRKADDKYNKVVLPALESTERTLSTVRDGSAEFVDAFDRVSTPDNNPLSSDKNTEPPFMTQFLGSPYYSAMPAIRYPRTEPSPNREANGTDSTPATRKMKARSRKSVIGAPGTALRASRKMFEGG